MRPRDSAAMAGPDRTSAIALIVEFSGVPGAGKSYLADKLAAALAAAGHTVDQPLSVVSPTLPPSRRALRKLRVAGREALRDPITALRIIVAIARSGQPPRDFLHRAQNWLVVRALFRQSRHRPGTHVFDQGIVQELCSLGYRGRWRDCIHVAAPGRHGLAPDVIVQVAAPVGTAQRRLFDRQGRQSRVEALDDEALHRVLHEQALELDEIVRTWVERFGDRRGSRIVKVDNAATNGVDLDRIIRELA